MSVGFCAGTRHADFMATQFQSLGETALSLSARSHSFTERQAIYQRLQDPNDSLQWLFVSDLLNEGVDLPAINSILFLRPTESPTLFLQQLGRGLRLFSGTEVLTVLDFVGHHLAAWNPMRALLSNSGSGTMSSVAGTHLRPPMGCEIVLQRRTREILEKIAGLQKNKNRALDLLRSLRNVLGRSPLPADCMGETLDAAEVIKPFGSWLVACERAGVAPAWAERVPAASPLRSFLRALEVDWQAARVSGYATAWALVDSPRSLDRGLDRFFQKFPHWKVEPDRGGLATAKKKIKESRCWRGDTLSSDVLDVIGHDELMKEVEGRLLPRLQQDWLLRHGSPLSTPDKLVLFGALSRPEIVRHFGVHYDPIAHYRGVLQFERDGRPVFVLLTDLGSKNAKYRNRILSPDRVQWASEKKMSVHEQRARALLSPETAVFLFGRQPRGRYFFFGQVAADGHHGSKPFSIEFKLPTVLPAAILGELGETKWLE